MGDVVAVVGGFMAQIKCPRCGELIDVDPSKVEDAFAKAAELL